jgi:hypothetical protein
MASGRTASAFETTSKEHFAHRVLMHPRGRAAGFPASPGILIYTDRLGCTADHRPVPGLASMSRATKASPWTAWINLEPRLASNMLTLLDGDVRLHLTMRLPTVASGERSRSE